jgi:predicted PurR-regulated permease PerM
MYGMTTRGRIVFLSLSALVTVVVIVAARSVMLPFVLGVVVAYVLAPAVSRVERARVPRWVAILLVYAISLGAIGGSIGVMVPRLITEGKLAAAEWPRLSETARTQWLPSLDATLSQWTGQPVVLDPGDAPQPNPPTPIRAVKKPDGSFELALNDGLQLRQVREGVFVLEPPAQAAKGISSASMLHQALARAGTYLRDNSLELLKIGQGIVMALSRFVFTLFMTLMLAGYMILTREKILAFFRDLWAPQSRDSFDRFLRRLDRGLSGVVRGQLLICLVNGVLSALGFWLFDLKYWPILALVAGVMSLIPIFGSILSSVPAVAIGLTQSPGVAFSVLAWIVGIHQLEANFLNPKIIGDAAKIHPVLVVMALLIGEHFAGIAGALFAVPCISIAQTIFLHFRESTLGLADPMASIPPQRSGAAPPTLALSLATPSHADTTPVNTGTAGSTPAP